MTTQTVTLRLTVQNGQFVSAVKASKGELDGLGSSGEVAGRKLDGGMTVARRGVASISQQLANARQEVIRLAGAFLSIQGARQLATAATQAQAITRTFAAATGSAEQGALAFSFVREQAERLGLDLKTSAQSFAQFTAAAQGTAIEGRGAAEIFTAVSEASTVLGLSAERTEGALLALQQMVSKGTVQAEELRGQLGERLPGAFQIAARAMGLTTAELGKALERGEVMAEDLLPKLATELRRLYSGPAQEAANSLQANLNRTRTALFDLQTAINEAGASDAFNSLAKGATGALLGVTALLRAQTQGFSDSAGLAVDWSSAWRAAVDNTLLFFARIPDAVTAITRIVTVSFLGAGDAVTAGLAAASDQTQVLFFAAAGAVRDAFARVVELAADAVRKVADLAAAVPFGDALADRLDSAAASLDGFSAAQRTAADQSRALADTYRDEADANFARAQAQIDTAGEIVAETLATAAANDAARQAAIDNAGAIRRVGVESFNAADGIGTAGRASDAATEALKRQAEEAARAAAALRDAGRAVLDGLLTPFEQAQATLNEQAATLFEAFEAGLLEGLDRAGVESAVAALVERFNAEWVTGAKDGADQYASVFEEELAKHLAQMQIAIRQDVLDTAISLGVEIDDDALKDLQKEFKELEDLGKVFDRIGGRAGEAFAQMSRLAKDLGVLQRGEAQASFGAYATLAAGAADALAGLAGEGSSAAQALTLASQVASTAAAIHAVAQAAAAPFPAGFAAAAAMISLMQSIGALSGGGSGSSAGALDAPRGGGPIQTSGTVLGRPDEDSASVANSIETLVGIEEEGLRISRDQLAALRAIERATDGITSQFARVAARRGVQSLSFGGTAGDVSFAGANSTSVPLSELLAILSSPESIQAYIARTVDSALPIAQGLQSIFDELGTALVTSVTAFGGSAEEARRIFEALPLGTLTIREGEDIDAAIDGLISAVGDSAIAAASDLLGIPLAQFQQFGEGALETLVRLTAQFVVLNDGAAALGLTIGQTITGLSGREKFVTASTEQLIAIADDLAQRAGGVDAFASSMAAFLDVTLTEGEKLTRQGDILREALGGVGIAMPASAEGLRSIAQGLDLTTEAGRAAFSTLIELAPALGDYYDAIADREAEIADQRLSLQERLAAATGDTALAEQVHNELLAQQRSALDASNQALFDQVIAAEAAAAAEQQLAAERQRIAALEIRLATAQGDTAGALALRRQQELAQAASDAERALLQQIFAAEDQATATQAAARAQTAYSNAVRASSFALGDAAADERQRLESELLRLVGATEELRRRERDALQASNRSLFDSIRALEDLKAANDETIGGLRSLRQSLSQAANDAVAAPLAQVRASFDAIAQRAFAGDTEALRGLASAGEQLRAASESQATTRIEYLRDLARLSSVAGAAETLAERQFDELAQQTLLLAGIRNGIDALRGVPPLSTAPAPFATVTTPQPLTVATRSLPALGGSPDLTRELVALREEFAELRRLVKSIDDRGEEIAREGIKVAA